MGLLLSSTTTPSNLPEVDSVFVFAVDLEQPRFDMNPSFHLVFDPNITSKLAQNWVQIWSNISPRLTSNLAQNLVLFGPKTAQDGPKRAQDGPSWPKIAQDGPKMAPRLPKMTPRWPQDGPRRRPCSNFQVFLVLGRVPWLQEGSRGAF